MENETKEVKEEVKEEPKEDTEGLLEKANQAAERLEKANEELKGLLAQQATMKVEKTLGGETEAGKEGKTKEQKETEEAKKLIEGSGFEDILEEKKN